MAALPPPSSSSSRRARTGDRVTVGSFVVEDEIGTGSFASVFRGHHKSTGALVAVKSVNLSKLNKKLKENLYCEIEILKGLHHPHIVALIDCRETSSHIHLVMEYCKLGDLSYFIKKRDRLGDNPALRDMVRKYPMPPSGGLNEVIVRHFLKQLASAMEFLRDRNFIHRDIKPQNLLLLPSPQYLANVKDQPLVMSASNEPLVPMVGLDSLPMLKIADFGFARSLPSTSLAETLCGSPLYMAPEILRYEKYDAKADLWSAGTVLFEMMVGKPPFRASNHVELLRRIEQSEDHISFPKSAVISDGMRQLIKALLKRTPIERIPFEDFFRHEVVVEPIPGLVEDDRPRETRTKSILEESSLSRNSSVRKSRRPSSSDKVSKAPEVQNYSSSPREKALSSSPRHGTTEPTRQVESRPMSREKLVRPPLNPLGAAAITAPTMETRQGSRTRNFNPISKSEDPVPRKASAEGLTKLQTTRDSKTKEEIAEAEQAVRDAREYVLVEKRAVEVNAFADEMAANPRLSGAKPTSSSKAGQITRRTPSQGSPTSPISTTSAAVSRGLHITTSKGQANNTARPSSYGKSYSSSPSTTSAIAKALQGASVRMFGVSWSPSLVGKGVSPPQLYSPFPAYPTAQVNAGLLEDTRPNGPLDEDQRAIKIIEDIATRSDVVYGFAEVKYKQLIPLAPSMEHGLGGPTNKSEESLDDDGLTIEATVALCEEALVLYVKSLSLLAKSMDYAGAWWSRRSRGEVLSGPHVSKRESEHIIAAGNRINAAVQWVRNRFNEVLEKAEFVRLKLLEAQKQLPEDHPGHPNNHTSASRVAGTSSSTGGVHLSSGVTAEKLMYDRALEMSRAAAINEIANEDLPGCDISYVTAIRMLEAVLENDEEVSPQRKRSGSYKEDTEKSESDGATINGINLEDRQAVQKVLSMVRSRLSTLRKKMALIAKHQSQNAPSSPRPSSVSHSGGVTPTLANTPPR
ncbi:hypothetical protein F5884DRAFT_849344 [Xylogone sp. PMI_703]|nr:hypothetical protein F5884DRAFT_849344 [Xylogone sp. PMI_703]